MSDARSLPRWKRVFLCVSLLICLFTVNCSLFTVRARANPVYPETNEGVFSNGIPIDMEFEFSVDRIAEDEAPVLYDVLIPSANVFYYDESGMPNWFGYVGSVNGGSTDAMRGLYYINYAENHLASYDIDIHMLSMGRLKKFSTVLPVVVSSYTQLNEQFNLLVVVGSTDLFTVNYFYVVIVPVFQSDGTVVLQRKTVSSSRSFNGGRQIVVLYDNEIVDSLIRENSFFFDSSGAPCAWIESASVSISGNDFLFPSGFYSIEERTSNSTSIRPLSHYIYDQSEGFVSIFADPSVSVSFDDISWTDWLVNSVGAFMDFELVPNFSIGGLMALLIGMSLFMIFLKVFAGG